MIKGEKKASASAIAAQQYRLRTQFKEDWSDKQESKVTIEDTGPQLTEDQLVSQIITKLKNKHLVTQIEEALKDELRKELSKEDNPTIN